MGVFLAALPSYFLFSCKYMNIISFQKPGFVSHSQGIMCKMICLWHQTTFLPNTRHAKLNELTQKGLKEMGNYFFFQCLFYTW